MMNFLIDHKDEIDVLVKLIQGFVSIFVIFSIIFAFIQLRIAKRNVKVNALKAEFDIFDKISEKEKIYVDYSEGLESQKVINEEEYNLYLKHEEQYFRKMNLICFYAMKDYLEKNHLFREYGGKILSIYNKSKEKNTLEKYANINEVCQKYEKELRKYAV